MDRTKVKLTIEVELDPIPGVFSTPESAEETLQDILENCIPHYNPTVTLV
jgi:hypothetical protein